MEMELFALELLSACQAAAISTEEHRLSSSHRQNFADFAQKQSKSDKIREWKDLPIEDMQQRQIWWSAKQEAFLGAGAIPLHKQLDTVSHRGIAPVHEQAGSVQSVGTLPSLAKTFQQSPLFAASPSTSVHEGPTMQSFASISHDAGTGADGRPSQQDHVAGTPTVLMTPTAAISPSASLDVGADKWRKYF